MEENKAFEIKGDGMQPNYKAGQFYITELFNSQKHTINRGDVLIFKSPPEPYKVYLKRVIALPGDTLMIQEGDLYLNGEKLEEAYIDGTKTYGAEFLMEGRTITVPGNHYFMMGDNRPYSSDSRTWGFLPGENIVSIVKNCYLHCK